MLDKRILIHPGISADLNVWHASTYTGVAENLIELYEAWGKPEKAEEWRAKLPHMENNKSGEKNGNLLYNLIK